MSKQLLVSSAIQAVLMNSFLLEQIQTGFWKDQRPSTHGATWDGVEVKVSDTNAVGPTGGFKPVRYYDFLNPEFTKLHEAKLVELAQTVKPGIKFKALKKELIELARIIGGRMTDKSIEPARVYRGNNRKDFDVIRTVNRAKVMTAAGAKAAVEAAASTVKKTAVKAPKADATVVKKTSVKAAAKAKAAAQDAAEGVVTTTTSTGAKVRRVPVQTAVKA